MAITPGMSPEQLVFQLIVEASEAEANIEKIGKGFYNLSKQLGKPIDLLLNTKSLDEWKQKLGDTKGMQQTVAQFETLIRQATAYAKALEKINQTTKGGTQRGAVADVTEQDKWFAQRQAQATAMESAARSERERRAQDFGKQLEEVNRLDKAWKELDARIKSGTASAKEFGDYLSSGVLSQKTMTAMQGVRGGDVTGNTVNSVKQAMAEIQSITKVSTDKVKAIMKSMFPNIDTHTIDAAAKKLQGIPSAAEKAAAGMRQFWNTVKGTLTAMAIFYVTQPIMDFFTNSVKYAEDARKKMAQLNFAESILSQAGMDITKKELEDLVSFIENKYKYLSKLDIQGIVTEVADMGAEFDLTKEQLLGLSDSVAFLQLKEKAYGMEVSDTGSIINAALDGRSNFFNRLGINITKTAIAEKAYAMGLAEQGAEITKAQANQAAIALLIEQTSGKYDELIASIDEVNPALANQLRFQKIYQETSTTMGESLLKIRDAYIELMMELDNGGSGRQAFLDWIKNSTDAIVEFIDAGKNAIGTIRDIGDGFEGITGKNPFEEYIKWVKGIQHVTAAAIQFIATLIASAAAFVISGFAYRLSGESVLNSYKKAGQAAAEAWKAGWERVKLIAKGEMGLFEAVPLPYGGKSPDERQNNQDTPTAPSGNKPPIEENQENLQKALEKMNNEILEAQIKLAQDMEEAAIDLGRKLEDITIEYAKKRADAERDYASKVRDINSDYRNKVAEINSKQAEESQKAKNDELEREAKFQEEMRQLKEKFLMDMDDALHARDARQVLRLIKQYNLDKAQAEREHALEGQKAARDQAEKKAQFARERADAERERTAKLEEAKRTYQDKLLQLKMDEDAERAAAQLAYQRKMQDLDREMKDRLELLAAGLIAEFNLTKSGMDAILALYQKYYGEITQIYAAMNTMLSGRGGYTTPASNVKPRSDGKPMTVGSGQRYAEGGVAIADRPTNAVFGERGLEMATFTPLDRSGQNVNKIFSSLTGGNAQDGNSKIEVALSPGLEGRIVNRVMDGTAEVILTTMREV